MKKCLELGADVGINYKSEDFVERTKSATGGKGAILSSPVCLESFDCFKIESGATQVAQGYLKMKHVVNNCSLSVVSSRESELWRVSN